MGPSENCHYIRLFLQPIILRVGAGGLRAWDAEEDAKARAEQMILWLN